MVYVRCIYCISQVEMPVEMSPSFYTHCHFLRFVCFIVLLPSWRALFVWDIVLVWGAFFPSGGLGLAALVPRRAWEQARGFSSLHEVALPVSEVLGFLKVLGLPALSCLPWNAMLRLNFMLVIERCQIIAKKKNICKAVIFSAKFFYKRIQMTIRSYFSFFFLFSSFCFNIFLSNCPFIQFPSWISVYLTFIVAKVKLTKEVNLHQFRVICTLF